jgi:hypothetical protein
MDFYHRQPPRTEQSVGRDCRFCATFDPNFAKRNPADRWVRGTPQDSAMSHVSENGHVLHRIFEIAKRRAQNSAADTSLAKSASVLSDKFAA